MARIIGSASVWSVRSYPEWQDPPSQGRSLGSSWSLGHHALVLSGAIGSSWSQPFRSGITTPDQTGAIRVIYERHLAHVHLTAWSRTSWWRRPRKLQHMASTLIRASSCHVFRNHLIRHICDVTRRAVMEHAKHVLACSASQEALYKGKIKP